ncbi:sugar phosphate isomerase/epimerase family protein [Pedobacter sandarakinus]|uniref:sugar phosphate isomerase/epimerase family protein n=1 Tax=Pedobacter sandarakinus TaxID=353156 RepID=UPI00224696C3|nr:TIM barrel protein [Pedobacter sandarakinus]MCX2574106.1 TIM barrel protein [Pedobacter sandarakinus]
MSNNRREFLKNLSTLSIASGTSMLFPKSVLGFDKAPLFQISLAQWSLQASLFKGILTNLDFPAKAKREFDIDIVEYVSIFFKKQETNKNYLSELKMRTDDLGVRNHLIMVDGEGDLGDLSEEKRNAAVVNHYKWVDAAKYLGCDKIRVNASGNGPINEVQDAVVKGLSSLTKYAKAQGISIIVENHGGYSSNGAWIANVMKRVDDNYCGTLPDFGNFKISDTETYDLYKGVAEMLPYAKGISAKTFNFDSGGYEPNIDYVRLFKMIKKSGFRGIVGIEWEGNSKSEHDGILATKLLLEKVKQSLS